MIKHFGRLCIPTGLALVGLLGSSPTVKAALSVNAAVGGSALTGQTYANFDSSTLGATTGAPGTLAVTLTSPAAAVTGSSPNVYSAPVLSGGNNTSFGASYTGADTTQYLTSGTGSITFTFGGATENYFGLLWGSVDSYNTLTFFDANGTNVGSLTGSQVATANAGTTVYANITSTIAFTRVVATSTSNSFEIDNVAFGTVPEPSSIALCGVAGAIGLVARRRRQRSA